MTESQAVATFIAQRQGGVLTRGIAVLNEAGLHELPELVHRLVGTFGTYQLDVAVASLLPLQEHLTQPQTSPEAIERERRLAVAHLTDVLTRRRERP